MQQGEYNGRVAVTNRHGEEDDESNDRFSRGRPGSFRPESAPTVLNMSPECSLSGPPSVRAGEASNSEEYHGHMMHNGEEISGTYDGNILLSYGFNLPKNSSFSAFLATFWLFLRLLDKFMAPAL